MATATKQEIQVEKAVKRFYRPELNLLRFIAFSMVFVTHVAGFSVFLFAGFFGVPIFFVLSAFLITELLQREKQQVGKISIYNFYIRRILRIWPLYFAALAFGFLFVLPVASRYNLSVKELLFYLFFIGNWWTAFHFYLPGGMGPLWSITVEEQFYLFWPWVVRGLGRRGILLAAGILWIVSQLTIVGIYHWTHPQFILLWTNTADNLQFLALGVALSAILNGKIINFRRSIRIALGLSSLAVFSICDRILYVHSPMSMLETMLVLMLTGLGATLLFLCLYGIHLPSWTSLFVYLGTVSYGLYVIHVWVWLIVDGTVRGLNFPHYAIYPLSLALTVILVPSLAILSYKYFESRFLRLKSRFQYVKSGSPL